MLFFFYFKFLDDATNYICTKQLLTKPVQAHNRG